LVKILTKIAVFGDLFFQMSRPCINLLVWRVGAKDMAQALVWHAAVYAHPLLPASTQQPNAHPGREARMGFSFSSALV
jgi:hypothetical protein